MLRNYSKSAKVMYDIFHKFSETNENLTHESNILLNDINRNINYWFREFNAVAGSNIDSKLKRSILYDLLQAAYRDFRNSMIEDKFSSFEKNVLLKDLYRAIFSYIICILDTHFKRKIELIDKSEESKFSFKNSEDNTQVLKKAKELLGEVVYRENLSKEVIQYAKDNNLIIIMGGSDDLMYVYGVDCYLTDYEEHDAGWDGEDLSLSENESLNKEASQLGLKILWCGKIQDKQIIENYSIEESGAFNYLVNDNINSLEFIIYENSKEDGEVYGKGLIVELPKNFEIAKYN